MRNKPGRSARSSHKSAFALRIASEVGVESRGQVVERVPIRSRTVRAPISDCVQNQSARTIPATRSRKEQAAPVAGVSACVTERF